MRAHVRSVPQVRAAVHVLLPVQRFRRRPRARGAVRTAGAAVVAAVITVLPAATAAVAIAAEHAVTARSVRIYGKRSAAAAVRVRGERGARQHLPLW